LPQILGEVGKFVNFAYRAIIFVIITSADGLELHSSPFKDNNTILVV